jgi:hypothetical protein
MMLQQGLVPAVTSELFGLENFATNYAMIMLGPAAGAQACLLPQLQPSRLQHARSLFQRLAICL